MNKYTSEYKGRKWERIQESAICMGHMPITHDVVLFAGEQHLDL